MHSVRSIFVSLLVVTLMTMAFESWAHPASLRDSETVIQMKALYDHFIKSAASDSDLRPGLMRAGFHDCATAHAGNPDSGCNGSLRKETDITNNGNLADTVKFVVDSVTSVAPLVSYADAFMLGMAASTFVAGGGSIVLDVVNPEKPRVDYSGDDGIGPNRSLSLPDPFTFDFRVLLRFYEERGMNARDLVISVVVGHSLGALDTNPFETDTGPALDFVPQNDMIGNQYAGHLKWLSKNGGVHGPDANGFNTLPSDRALITDKSGLRLLDGYIQGKLKGEKGNGVQFLDSQVDSTKRCIASDFRTFAIKLSKLSGAVVGKGPIKLSSDDRHKPCPFTKGWDDHLINLTPNGKRQKILLTAGDFPAGRSQWYTATEAQKTAFFTNNGGKGTTSG